MTPLQGSAATHDLRESPPLSWEDVQRYLALSPRSRPSLMDHDRALSAVLSATSYPLEGQLADRRAQEDIPDSELPLYGGILLENSPEEDDDNDTSINREKDTLTNNPRSRAPSKRQRDDDGSAVSSKKRGRPRKTAGQGEETSISEVCQTLFSFMPELTDLRSDAGYKSARLNERISHGEKQTCHR